MQSISAAAQRVAQIKTNPSLLLGLAVVVLIVGTAVAAPLITGASPEEARTSMNMPERLQGPSAEHPLGTDNFGRDLVVRIVYGARQSLVVGLVSVSIAATIGTAVGLLAGFYGGTFDTLVMRVVDIFLSFPVLILAIALVAVLGPGVINAMIALGLIYWTRYARLVRASVLAETEKEYVAAARASGVSSGRIMLRHILPNCLSPIIVLASLGMGEAIIAESTLSFLGLGVQPPDPSWGWALAFGMRFIRSASHLATFPGIAIMLTVLGFNLLGDGLRDALDPQQL